MKEALLVIDMQKMFYKGKTKIFMDNACEKINTEISSFRKKGNPVIWIYHTWKFGKLKKGNLEYEFIDLLQKDPNVICIEKTYPNSFRKTELKKILDNQKIDSLKLCGYKAEACVLFTYFGAKKFEYIVSIIKNGVASNSKLGIEIGKLFYGSSII